jgi:Predicted phosphoesterase
MTKKRESIAVISDVHGNRLALEAVLNDIEERGIAQVVNLGDSLFGPLDPLGVAELLRKHPSMIHLMGNCDEILLEERELAGSYGYVKPLLDEGLSDWIRGFRPAWEYEDLLFCHGTPYSNREYLLEKVSSQGQAYKEVEELVSELEGMTASYVFCGHSHVPCMKALPGGLTIVNAGSVGLPAYYEQVPYPHRMEAGSPHARYCIVARSGTGEWSVEPIAVEYDWEQASRQASDNGRMDYAYSLLTGRAIPDEGI